MSSSSGLSIVPARVASILEEERRCDKCWDDFEHGKTLRRIGSRTSIVYERNGDDHAMQFCWSQQWSLGRASLVELTQQENKMFLATHFMFSDKGYIFVGSEIADMCLADVIHCTVPMTDAHVGAVLMQVIRALSCVEQHGMEYKGLKASNVFVSKGGDVKLANFGPTLNPLQRDHGTRNSDCEDVGHLAYYMLSKRPRMLKHPGNFPQIMVRVGDFYLNTDVEFTPQFLEFLRACISANNIVDLLMHPFLSNADLLCLKQPVRSAIYNADRQCENVNTNALLEYY